MINNSDDKFMEFLFLLESTDATPRRERWHHKQIDIDTTATVLCSKPMTTTLIY